MNRPLRVLVSGGGTGGHIYPAVAIVEAIRKLNPDVEILFVGANGKMEMEKIPQLGYKIEGISVDGVQRSMSFKNIIRNAKLPFKLIHSFFRMINIINQFKPDIAIGTGGYASGPSIKIAQWMGVPTYIQEQNALPGYTNKLLAPRARAIFTSFEDANNQFANKNVIHTGNAIRESFADEVVPREKGIEFFGLNPNLQTVFITGGSLGSSAINTAISNGLDTLAKHQIQIIWQTGKREYEKYKSKQSNLVKVVDFIPEMQLAYAAADIIVTRAGGTLFELFVIGKPLIVLPSPNVAEDHQTKNAESLEAHQAAIMVKDKDANQNLVNDIITLLQDKERMEKMSTEIKKLALPRAASTIANYILNDYKQVS